MPQMQGLWPLVLRNLRARPPRAGSLDEVTRDAGLASALQATGAPRALTTGDDVRLLTGTGNDAFRVVGISSGTSAGPAFTRSAAFISEEAAQTIFGQGLRTPLVALRLDAGASATTVAQRIHDALGPAALTVDPRSLGVQPLDQLRPLLALVTVLSVAIG